MGVFRIYKRNQMQKVSGKRTNNVDIIDSHMSTILQQEKDIKEKLRKRKIIK